MKRKLTLIKGGKAPPGTGKNKKGRKPLRRPHPYNDLLWYATSTVYYSKRAVTVEMIAHRMTRVAKRVLGYEVDISKLTAQHCIADCRRRRYGYNWMLLNVEKGSDGFHRGYVPILVDVDKDDTEWWLLEDSDMEAIGFGVRSAMRTEASMLEITADGLLFTAAFREASGHNAEAFRELVDDANYLARKLRQLANRSDAFGT